MRRMKRNPPLSPSPSSPLFLFHLMLVYICIIYLVFIYHLYSAKESWYQAVIRSH